MYALVRRVRTSLIIGSIALNIYLSKKQMLSDYYHYPF